MLTCPICVFAVVCSHTCRLAPPIMPSTSTYFQSSCEFAAPTDRVIDQLLAKLPSDSGPPTLAVLFVSPHFIDDLEALAGGLCDRLDTTHLVGCSGESIVAGNQEFEDSPCASLWCAWWPDAYILLRFLEFQQGDNGPLITGVPEPAVDEQETILMLVEPYSFPADVLLEHWNHASQPPVVFGGMAGGGHGPGQQRLIAGRSVYDKGAIGCWLDGVPVDTVVSQGCRPIGQPMIVTKAERNEILELGRMPALQQFHEIYEELPAREQAMVRSGCQLGRVVNEYQDSFDIGDFLIRNVTGIDEETKCVVVSDFMRVGQTVQFHIRDAESADADLRQLLTQYLAEQSVPPLGCLIFTCNGRGTRMFEQPHHDAGVIAEKLQQIPAAGFFCQGEIGPVGGKNFLHGFTASVAIFR